MIAVISSTLWGFSVLGTILTINDAIKGEENNAVELGALVVGVAVMIASFLTMTG